MSRSKVLEEVGDLKKRLIAFFVIVSVLLIFSTISFMWIKKIDFISGFILTLETLGYLAEPEAGMVRFLQIFLTLIGVFLVWWVLWSLTDLLVDGTFTKYLKLKYYTRLLSNMKDHYIIVGGGRVGEEIAEIISKKKSKFVIIEQSSEVIKHLKKKGYLVVEGDATNEEILKQSNIDKAKKIAITLPVSEKNLLITMTAKELNPTIEIHARADKKSIASKLKKAGAKTIIIPEIIAGDELAKEL